MERNYLSGCEELLKEACFKHLYATFKFHLSTDPDKNEKFMQLTEYVVNEGIVGAVKYSKSKTVFFYNKNLITRRDFFCLMANVYVRFFGASLSMKTYVSIGCALFDCAGQKNESIYMSLKRQKNNEIPTPYTKFF